MDTQQLEHQINEFIGNHLRYLRRMHGLTQEGIGRELSVAPQQIQKYEKGTNRLSAAKLYLLAEVFKMPIESFYPGQQEPEGQKPFSHQLSRILRIINSIPEEHHIEIEAVLRAFQKISSSPKYA